MIAKTGTVYLRGVQKGVVICSFSKDYKLQSWNEQGKIIQIEGILTIAFYVISSCSYIDSKNQLYCEEQLYN